MAPYAAREQGLNWFGQEGPKRVPHGLALRSVDELMAFMEANGFNALRLFFSLQNVEENLPTPATAFSAENSPELAGTDYIGMLLAIARKAAQHDILVLLACHRIRNGYPDDKWPGKWNGRWTDKDWMSQRVFSAWMILTSRFCPKEPDATLWNVMGADVLNEPFGMEWDDWADAAKQLGNFVLHACPQWLVFVEGPSRRATPPHHGEAARPMLACVPLSPPPRPLHPRPSLHRHRQPESLGRGRRVGRQHDRGEEAARRPLQQQQARLLAPRLRPESLLGE